MNVRYFLFALIFNLLFGNQGHTQTDTLKVPLLFETGTNNKIFKNGEGTHPCYRIPAITTAKNGDIVAFSEGRRNMHDHSHNDLVIRRSTDNGKHWSPYKVILKNENVMVNPSPVTLVNGDILIFIEEFPNGYHARAGKDFRLLTEGFDKGR